MPTRNVAIVYRKELTEALRDRRTLISTIIVPLFLFPVLSVGFGALAVSLVGKAKEEIPKVILRGGGDSPAVVEGLKKGADMLCVVTHDNSSFKLKSRMDVPIGHKVAASAPGNGHRCDSELPSRTRQTCG